MSDWNGSAWRAVHLHYHGDRDLLLDRCIRPLVHELTAEGAIEQLYFIRYAVGGPHVRLRYLPGGSASRAGDAGLLTDRIRRRASEFFAQHPSVRRPDAGTILATSRALAAAERDQGDAELVPDHRCVERPPQFEVERYGGAELFPASLELFEVSSMVALDHVRRFRDATPGGRLTMIWRALAAQALAAAETCEDLCPLLEYTTAWGEAVAPLSRRADDAYDSQPRTYRNLLTATAVELVHGNSSAQSIYDATQRLRSLLAPLTPKRRWRVLTSHLHMTANRLGAGNREETYVCRLIARALESITTGGGREMEVVRRAVLPSDRPLVATQP